MNIEYMRTAKKSYMIIKKTEFPFEQYELNMILQNDITCLLPLQVMTADGSSEYWYDVSGMQPLKTRFTLESMDGKFLRFLLENLIEMKTAMEEYLLDDSNISFSAEMVYFERSPERIRFCYIPGLGGDIQTGLKELFEEILQHLNHSDPNAVQIGYGMYERCARNSFTVEDCLDCIKIEENTGIQESSMVTAKKDILWENTAVDVPDPGTDLESEKEIEFLFKEPEQRIGHRKKRKKEKEKRKRPVHESETEEELLFALRPAPPERSEDLAQTEVIFEDCANKTWELIYKGNGIESDFIISDFPFLIGTDSGKADGVLHARTVSRIHARLNQKDDKLIVEDFNSTNGTYLNQRLLPMNTPAELKDGDRIVFATEEYAVFCRRTGGIN